MSEESNLAGRVTRLARVGAGVGATVARVAAGRLLSSEKDLENEARLFREALAVLKGPIMKVAQLIATIPDALPAEYAAELSKLQSQAPPMGRPSSSRRMQAELGPDWRRFASFGYEPPPPPRWARSTAHARMAASRWPASSSIRTCSRRWKPT